MSPGHVIKYCAFAMRDGDSLHAAFAFPPLLFLFSITRQLSNCFPPFSIFLARFSRTLFPFPLPFGSSPAVILILICSFLARQLLSLLLVLFLFYS